MGSTEVSCGSVKPLLVTDDGRGVGGFSSDGTVRTGRSILPEFEIVHEFSPFRHAVKGNVPRFIAVFEANFATASKGPRAELIWIILLHKTALLQLWVKPEEHIVNPAGSRFGNV